MIASITGSEGFIGSALAGRLEEMRWLVYDYPVSHADYLFHFGSPSSQILFNEDINCVNETITGFLDSIKFCRKYHIKLIYPSSATTYINNDSYAHTKSALEQIQQAYNIPALALRIFAGYGEGEGHKKDYASVAYQFAKKAIRNEEIVIYGDGTQTRDFVYIGDIVDTIVDNLNTTGWIDIGTGVNTSFNALVFHLKGILGRNIATKYVDKPKIYIQDTKCERPITKFTPIEEGLRRICSTL